MIAADACSLLFLALAQVDLGLGLVAVAAFAGWLTGVALIWGGTGRGPRRDDPDGGRGRDRGVVGGHRPRPRLDLGLAQGGVLGPLDYVVQRFGLVAPLAIAAAAGVAALRAR